MRELVIGAIAGLMFGLGMWAQKSRPDPGFVDVTEMRFIGIGCGAQPERIYLAREEDELPGPRCTEVRDLVRAD